MPALSMFYGVVVYMYFMDTQQHHAPHIHARFQGEEAVFAIVDGGVLGGTLPSGKLKLVQAWIEIHRDELAANWELAVKGEPVFKIEPLR